LLVAGALIVFALIKPAPAEPEARIASEHGVALEEAA
jgi:hypothetical protein